MKVLSATAFTLLALVTSPYSGAAPTESQMQGIAAAKVSYQQAKQAIEKEQWDAAIAALQNAERLDPISADTQNMLGYTHRQKGDLESAFKYYKRAIELDPYHRGAREYMGRAYLEQSRPEKAKELLAELESICPEKCAERDMLKRAIADWDPWKRASRGARSY